MKLPDWSTNTVGGILVHKMHGQSRSRHLISRRCHAVKLEKHAPLLWSLLGHLLSSDPSREKQRAEYAMGDIPPNHRDASWDEEDEYWDQLEEHEDNARNDLADGDNADPVAAILMILHLWSWAVPSLHWKKHGFLPNISSVFMRSSSKDGIRGVEDAINAALGGDATFFVAYDPVISVPTHCVPAGSACPSKFKFRPLTIFRSISSHITQVMSQSLVKCSHQSKTSS